MLFVCCGGPSFSGLAAQGFWDALHASSRKRGFVFVRGLINSLGQWPEGMNGPSKFAVGDIGFPDILIPLVTHSLLGGW